MTTLKSVDSLELLHAAQHLLGAIAAARFAGKGNPESRRTNEAAEELFCCIAQRLTKELPSIKVKS